MGYSHYEVAHRWANHVGESCRGNSMYFVGNFIYSYGDHFIIAQHYNGVVLFNEDTYSPSTSKHQCYVRHAASHLKVVYCAALSYGYHPVEPGYSSREYEKKMNSAFIKKNLKLWEDKIHEIVTGPLAKARKPEKYLLEIRQIVGRCMALCDVMKVKCPKRITDFLAASNDDKIIVKMQELEAKRLKSVERAQEKKLKEDIEKFMSFKTSWFSGPFQIVRLNKEKNRFETSKGVECPFELGRQFYEKLKADQIHVGDQVLFYRVGTVNKDVISIGCHTFKRSYLLKYGKEVFAQ